MGFARTDCRWKCRSSTTSVTTCRCDWYWNIQISISWSANRRCSCASPPETTPSIASPSTPISWERTTSPYRPSSMTNIPVNADLNSYLPPSMIQTINMINTQLFRLIFDIHAVSSWLTFLIYFGWIGSKIEEVPRSILRAAKCIVRKFFRYFSFLLRIIWFFLLFRRVVIVLGHYIQSSLLNAA